MNGLDYVSCDGNSKQHYVGYTMYCVMECPSYALHLVIEGPGFTMYLVMECTGFALHLVIEGRGYPMYLQYVSYDGRYRLHNLMCAGRATLHYLVYF